MEVASETPSRVSGNHPRKVCAFAVGYGPHYRMQSILLRNSFKTFHPEIPIFIFGEEDEEHLFGAVDRDTYIGVKRLRFGCHLLEEFDGVVLLGTDVVVCNTLESLLYPPPGVDIVATLDIKRTSPIAVDGSRYANADVVGIHNASAMMDWCERSVSLTKKFRLPPHSVNDWEQGVLNFLVLPNAQYDVSFPECESDVYFNLRSRWFWSGAYVYEKQLYAENNRLIRSIHWNGSGGTLPNRKIRAAVWSDDVLDFFCTVTNVDLRQFPQAYLPFSRDDAIKDLGGQF